jgi:hypothetical protein
VSDILSKYPAMMDSDNSFEPPHGGGHSDIDINVGGNDFGGPDMEFGSETSFEEPTEMEEPTMAPEQ